MENFMVSSNKGNHILPSATKCPFLGIYEREMKAYTHTNRKQIPDKIILIDTIVYGNSSKLQTTHMLRSSWIKKCMHISITYDAAVKADRGDL